MPSGVDSFVVEAVWIHGVTWGLTSVDHDRFRATADDVPPLLKGRRLDHSHQEGGEPPPVSIEPLDDPVDRLDVIIIEPAAECISQ